MFPGGIRALLLQALHPVALTGVEEHSDYRSDPWTRVQNTSGSSPRRPSEPSQHAEEVIARVRRIHRAVAGTMPDGTPYAADDPHLLRWVHIAEVESFLSTHQRFGERPLTAPEADIYVAQTARVSPSCSAWSTRRSTAAALRADIERPSAPSSPPPRRHDGWRGSCCSTRRSPAGPPCVRAAGPGALATLPVLGTADAGPARRPCASRHASEVRSATPLPARSAG